jgi:hypothetical protein
MPDCKYLKKCPFFNDMLRNMPTASDTIKRIYCRWSYKKCARFMVAETLGPKNIPQDLFPGDSHRADIVLLQFNETGPSLADSDNITLRRKIKCWEIIKCTDSNCPARKEPETPCWEIAERTGAYRDVSNTCRDCVVYILKTETSNLSREELKQILLEKGFLQKTEKDPNVCVLKKIKNPDNL